MAIRSDKECLFEKYCLFQRAEFPNITVITIKLQNLNVSNQYVVNLEFTQCCSEIHIFYIKGRRHLCDLPYWLVILSSESMCTHISKEPKHLPLLHESWASNNYFPSEIWFKNVEFAQYRRTVTLGKLDGVIYFYYTFFREEENSGTFMYFLLICLQYLKSLIALLYYHVYLEAMSVS